MKTISAAALFLLLSAPVTHGLFAVERREFVSKAMNSNVQKLLENCNREIIGQEPFSSKNNDNMDHMIGFYDTDHGLLVTLQKLKQRSDEHGRAIPDVYNSELVAVVFVDKLLLWYQ